MSEAAKPRDMPDMAVLPVKIGVELVLVERPAAAGAQAVVLTAAADLHNLVLEDVGFRVEALTPPSAAYPALAQAFRDPTGREARQPGLLFVRRRPSSFRQIAKEIAGALRGLDESAEPLLSPLQFLVFDEDRPGEQPVRDPIRAPGHAIVRGPGAVRPDIDARLFAEDKACFQAIEPRLVHGDPRHLVHIEARRQENDVIEGRDDVGGEIREAVEVRQAKGLVGFRVGDGDPRLEGVLLGRFALRRNFSLPDEP